MSDGLGKVYPPLSELVPHEPPMLWIDEVLSCEAEAIVCQVTLRDEHPFLDDGVAESIVTVELMAQSVAAFVGISDRAQGEVPRPGYLVAIPEARFFVAQITRGQVLQLSCARRFGAESIASFDCRAECKAPSGAKTLVAEAVINVVRPSPHG